MRDTEAQLLGLLRRVASPAAVAWLEETLTSLDFANDRAVRIALARCGRKVGQAGLQPLDGVGLPAAVGDHWCHQDIARAVIVMRMFCSRGDDAVSLFDTCVRRGEQGEQASYFRMLALLPAARELVPTAVEGCRTNSEVVFRAIACRNPFPAAHFPELNFNQLVLKAIFMGVEVSAVDGVAGRVNDDLVRMARDFAAERSAAGRSIPPDVSLLETLLESR